METIQNRFEQSVITEKRFKDSDFDKVVVEISKLTSNKQHIDALVMGAKLLNNISGKGIKLLKLVQYISDIYDIEGEIPAGLDKYKYLKYKDMTKLSYAVLSPDQHNRFINAF